MQVCCSAPLYCIHAKKLSCFKSGVEFDMNDILYEFKNLHHFKDSLTFGVNTVLDFIKSKIRSAFQSYLSDIAYINICGYVRFV